MIHWTVLLALYAWAGFWLTYPQADSDVLKHHPLWARMFTYIAFMTLWVILFPVVILAKKRDEKKEVKP